MGGSAVDRKVSWTIEADVLEQVQRRVPRGQQSAHATKALRRQLERDGLEELIGELVDVPHGRVGFVVGPTAPAGISAT